MPSRAYIRRSRSRRLLLISAIYRPGMNGNQLTTYYRPRYALFSASIQSSSRPEAKPAGCYYCSSPVSSQPRDKLVQDSVACGVREK
jgi:hypothetical protein